MLLPAGAPAKFKDAATCFNSINNIEKGRIGYKLIVPFQKELISHSYYVTSLFENSQIFIEKNPTLYRIQCYTKMYNKGGF